MTEPEQTLRGDGGGRTIHWLELIERLGRSVEIITQTANDGAPVSQYGIPSVGVFLM